MADAELATATVTGTPRFNACYLAEVVAVDDPDGLSRVQVRLLAYDGPAAQDGPVWARVSVPFAGNDYGAFMIPDVGEEVLVVLIGGDPRQPVVVGSLWNGSAVPPEGLGGAGDRVDRWTVVGKAGSRIAIVEEESGRETIVLEAPGGVSATLTAGGGGEATFRTPSGTVTMDSEGVSVETGGKVEVQATQVEVTAAMVKVDAAMSEFSGVVKCDTLIATSVISSSYTPGAGNIW